ncbi:hypothetical protein, partial [Paraburkholderia sp. UYCP14C]|uniref:hypothetical protein n=1 Tax=Paraburkholderia sp. UYCP14C TaxID=2511130 RepID=UPI001B7D6DFB
MEVASFALRWQFAKKREKFKIVRGNEKLRAGDFPLSFGLVLLEEGARFKAALHMRRHLERQAIMAASFFI